MSSIPIYSLIFFFYCFRHHRDLHSFPTRRSSDLRIYIGAVAEDSSGYPDCRPEFYEAFQRVIDTGTKPETRIEIVTPVIDLRKAEIVKRGVELSAPFELTWSCYQAENEACGRCDSCALRRGAFREAGMPDPIPYA